MISCSVIRNNNHSFIHTASTVMQRIAARWLYWVWAMPMATKLIQIFNGDVEYAAWHRNVLSRIGYSLFLMFEWALSYIKIILCCKNCLKCVDIFLFHCKVTYTTFFWLILQSKYCKRYLCRRLDTGMPPSNTKYCRAALMASAGESLIATRVTWEPPCRFEKQQEASCTDTFCQSWRYNYINMVYYSCVYIMVAVISS